MKKILIIDDDQEIGAMLQMMLELKGYHVEVKDRAHQIMSLLEHDSKDLILLDMLIADVKGTNLCKELKANVGTKYIPVIMFSALPEIEEECKKAGADGFISKPFELKELLSLIGTLIG